jgi:gamma-glutamylcysteine synthetase
MSSQFCEHFGFSVIGRDTDGNANSMQDDITGDNLSFECCYSNLELSLGKGGNLHEIKARFDAYYTFINNFFAEYGYTLTGMGINPNYRINHNKPIQNERYRMLYHHLHSYKKYKNSGFAFHHFPTFGTFTSASQVQIDVRYEDLTDVINIFGKLEPFKSVLFANSYMQDMPQLLCARNMLWERSMQGYNPHNIGMFEYELQDSDDFIKYIKSTSVYCTMRDGKYINFPPVPVAEYFNRSSVQGEYYTPSGYKDIEIEPNIDDLEYLRTFKFVDLTYRGTIEFRSMCTQPIYDAMSVAAFHAGLMERVGELGELLNSDTTLYSNGYNASELQRIMSKVDLPYFVDKKALSEMLVKIIDLSRDGLKQRGHGEEIFLAPLYERAEELTNPAKKMVEGLRNGKAKEYYIKEYSLLSKG